MKKKLVIIGSGISGLSAAFYLHKKFKITLIEENSYLGGHTHTHNLKIKNEIFNVDSGFIVFNNLNYKCFLQFLHKLKVKFQHSDMSFSVLDKYQNYEWSGKNLKTIFFTRNIFSLRYWIIIKEIIRFNYITKKYILKNQIINLKVSDFVKKYEFSPYFLNLYFYPMCASIWSNPIDEIKNYKMHFILKFFANHGLINIFKKRPTWYTIKNGSNQYVKKIIKLINLRKIINQKVTSVDAKKKIITTHANKKIKYDHLIIATHTDDALFFLKEISNDQKKVLNLVKYRKNTAILHTDEKIMPNNKINWSSWNFIRTKKNFALTYWMNLLQNLKIKTNVFVSINCLEKIQPKKIIKIINYKHPVFKNKIEIVKKKIKEIQGINNIWFVGAWQGYGFHEDGIKSTRRILDKIK